MTDAPFTNASLFGVNYVQRFDQTGWQNRLNWFANHLELFVQFPACTETSEVVSHSES